MQRDAHVALANPRWERFARLLHEGLGISQAYAEAGYVGGASAAHRLSRRPEIRLRLDALAQVGNDDPGLSHRIRAEHLYLQAMESGNLSVAAQVLRHLASLVEQEAVAPPDLSQLEQWSDADLEAALDDALERLGRNPSRTGVGGPTHPCQSAIPS